MTANCHHFSPGWLSSGLRAECRGKGRLVNSEIFEVLIRLRPVTLVNLLE